MREGGLVICLRWSDLYGEFMLVFFFKLFFCGVVGEFGGGFFESCLVAFEFIIKIYVLSNFLYESFFLKVL